MVPKTDPQMHPCGPQVGTGGGLEGGSYPARPRDRSSTNPHTTTGPRGTTVMTRAPRGAHACCHATRARDEAPAVRESRATAARPARATDHSRERQGERPHRPAALTHHLQARAARVPATHAHGLEQPTCPGPREYVPRPKPTPTTHPAAPSRPRGTGALCPHAKSGDARVRPWAATPST